MSLSQEIMLDLMAYADGELEGPDAERVEKLLRENDEARRLVAELGAPAVAAWLRTSQEEMAASKGADKIADAVMAKIAAPAPVSSLSARRARIGAAAAAALALAAGIAMYVAGEENQAPGGGAPTVATVNPPPPVETATPAPAPAPSPSQQLAQAEPITGVEVDGVESPASDVSVFYLSSPQSSDMASSVVIWLGDTPGGGKQ
jgi:anti-sigma factor RsiW